MTVKATKSTPASTRSVTIIALSQGYHVPPHWSAINKQMTPGSRQSDPGTSICLSWFLGPDGTHLTPTEDGDAKHDDERGHITQRKIDVETG